MSAVIDIKATYADMNECATILEDIGSDVKSALTELDDFLNKKMVVNGKQIYANWQSEARNIFEQKSKTVVTLFDGIKTECVEASVTLKGIIKQYEKEDATLAGTMPNVDPLDFTFGNMANVDKSQIGEIYDNVINGNVTPKPVTPKPEDIDKKEEVSTQPIEKPVEEPKKEETPTQPIEKPVEESKKEETEKEEAPTQPIETPIQPPIETPVEEPKKEENVTNEETKKEENSVEDTSSNTGKDNTKESFASTGDKDLIGGLHIGNSTLIQTGEGTPDTSAFDIGLTQVSFKAAYVNEIIDLVRETGLNNYYGYNSEWKATPIQTAFGVNVYERDGSYYLSSQGKYIDITESFTQFVNGLDSKGVAYTLLANALAADSFEGNSNTTSAWLAQDGKLYSDESYAQRMTEDKLFNDGTLHRYHPCVAATATATSETVGTGATNEDYANVYRENAIKANITNVQNAIDSLLKETGAAKVEWACDGKYYDYNGNDVTSAVQEFQAKASEQGLQYDYYNENHDRALMSNKPSDITINSMELKDLKWGNYAESLKNAIVAKDSSAFGGVSESGAIKTTGFATGIATDAENSTVKSPYTNIGTLIFK